MRPRAVVAFVVVATLALTALVFSVGTLVLTAADFLSRSAPAPVPTIEDPDLGTMWVYDVQPDASLDPVPSGLTATVWETWLRVVGPEFAGSTISRFQVGDAPESDTLAFVIRDARDVQRWELGANLAFSDVHSELVATLVHEYAHILSLNTAQVRPFVKTCETLDLDEGCAESDSYLVAFEREFWARYDGTGPDATNSDPDVADAFYAEHEEHFVSVYAATNVVEDFAESFMIYVLEPDVGEPGTPTAAKLAFFGAYPELVELRERIRAEFDGEF